MRSLGLKPSEDDLNAILLESGAMEPIPDPILTCQAMLAEKEGYGKAVAELQWLQAALAPFRDHGTMAEMGAEVEELRTQIKRMARGQDRNEAEDDFQEAYRVYIKPSITIYGHITLDSTP